VFKAVADNGSFVAAAAALDISCPAASRMVQDLESALGIQLIHRTTRRLVLTSAGEDVLQRACSLLRLYEDLASLGRIRASEPSGVVRMAAPTSFGSHYLGSALAAYRARYPGVQVELFLCEGPINVVSDEVDLALCLPEDLRPTQVARPLAQAQVGIYAAPGYLLRRGEPTRPSQLVDHDCLTSTTSRSGAAWSFQHRESAERFSVSIEGAMLANQVEVLADAAIHGGGIVTLPDFVARVAVARGQLRQILLDWHVAPLALHITYRSRRNQPMSVRKLIEHLIERLGAPHDTRPETIVLHEPKPSRSALSSLTLQQAVPA
jgi:DNA-binding transcriptional LysR family regulator